MCKKTKIWLFAAAALILAGCLLFGGALAVLGWDIKGFSTVTYETNEYEITEAYQSIFVSVDTGFVDFVPSENGETRVVCLEQEKVKHIVEVWEGVLTVTAKDTRRWYEYIGIGFVPPQITVYLPAGEYEALSANVGAGTVNVPADFGFADIEVTASTGNISSRASVSGSLRMKASTGDICVEGASVGSLTLSVSTGKISLSSVMCAGDASITVSTGQATVSSLRCENFSSTGDTGSITLSDLLASGEISIERSTGDVIFESCDAATLRVQTSTGHVRGTLLTAKTFVVETSTGEKEVPNTTGGRCEVTTTTGDIKLSIQ